VGEGWGVVFTSGTLTSAAIAAERLPMGAVHQYAPLDVGPFVERFLNHWRPEVAIVAESELWPSTLGVLARRKIPVVIVNGRLSDRSFPRWRRFRALVAPLFARISLVLAQSAEDAKRFTELGAAAVIATGNLKWDAAPLPADAGELRRLRSAIGARPVWLAASTHAGEVEIIASVHRALAATHPRLLTIVVPRHPSRGADVATVLAAAGSPPARRSKGDAVTADTQVYVADTLGELGLFYRLVRFTFLGNSLITPGGGHNPLEALQLGTAVISGPYVHNFADVFARLRRAAPDATVADAGRLTAAVDALLRDPTAAKRLAANQAEALGGMTGALEATFAALRPYLPPASG
jgi:3-deoxy-D-manno-octulosonic-acid transferase